MGSSIKVREPAVAGAFYPGIKSSLQRTVKQLLDEAKPAEIKGRLVGLISPHAGYMYSGGVAAYGYKLLEGRSYDVVVIVAPSHHTYFKGSSIYPQDGYGTPLGIVEIDTTITGALLKEDSIDFRPEAHLREHSLEVQLPFLQMTLKDLKIVPIVMGDQSLENCKRLAEAIVKVVKGRNVLLVASSDLSHFHTYEEAVRLDGVVLDDIEKFDPQSLASDLEARRCEACGGGPMITVMLAAHALGATKAKVLKYANSGDVTGDRSNVVGYVSAAIYVEEEVGVDLGLRQAEKEQLLRIARQSIEAKLEGKPIPQFEPVSDLLKKKMGAFVTLTKRGQLRGCIGYIRGVEPLYLTVSRMAIAAATEDIRFPPVRREELDEISIEISVLTPLKLIDDPSEIQVGRDGIYIEKGYNHGLLLPQVATEQGWNREEFLDHTCMKAGLPPGCWREGAKIYTFSAQIFNEEEVFSKESQGDKG